MILKLPKEFTVSKDDQRDELIPNQMEVGSLGDWFIHIDNKPKMYFNDILKFCSQILSCDMTKKYAPSMYAEGGF